MSITGVYYRCYKISVFFITYIVNSRLEIMPSGPQLDKPINKSVLLTCKPVVLDFGLLEDLKWVYETGDPIVNDVR